MSADQADPVTLDELARTFEGAYKKLFDDGVLRTYIGQHVVIHLHTGRYVTARFPTEAFEKAAQEFGSTDYCWSKAVEPH